MRALAALLALAAGCAHRPGQGPARLEEATVEGQVFRLQYWPGDEEAARQVRAALALAVPRVERWGRLGAPVLVTIHPSHEALEKAVKRERRPWLRAWARYASVDLQSPPTWGPPDAFLGSPSDEQVAELLAHELVHCAMYQAVGGEATWAQRDIPLWFREGLASVAAGQGHKRIGPEAIWRFYRDAASGEAGRTGIRGDPLAGPESPPEEPRDRGEADLVYGTAHRAFQFLLDRYGQARVRAVLERMGRGQPFGEAFRAGIGVAPRAFVDDFRRYIALQGWRQ